MSDTVQLELAIRRTPAALRLAIERAAGRSVQLTLTQNRCSLISLRWRDGVAALRVVDRFLDAPDDVVTSLGAYIRSRRRAEWAGVAQYARSLVTGPHATAGGAKRAMFPHDARGRVYDLGAVLGEVNRRYFRGRLQCRIEWGRPARRSRRRQKFTSIRYGSWLATRRMIRLNPILDNPRVPPEFLRYIVFHEALHSLIPLQTREGRVVVHPPQFKALERRFPDYARMRHLSRELLSLLK